MEIKIGLGRFNTLRNQIIVIFLFVMIIVLFLAGIVTFHLVSTLLEKNVEEHIQQTAIQTRGRLEALYRQIDTIANQIGTVLKA